LEVCSFGTAKVAKKSVLRRMAQLRPCGSSMVSSGPLLWQVFLGAIRTGGNMVDDWNEVLKRYDVRFDVTAETEPYFLICERRNPQD
jgi:hypothetical protein